VSETKQLRVVLPLGKARVVDRGAMHFKLSIGGSTTITITMPMDAYDIRDGDLLTLYTEVLLAKPSQPPVQ